MIFKHWNPLKEINLMPPNKHCLACGSIKITGVATLQKQPLVTLLQCQQCHISSASRLPTEEFLSNFYKNEFYSLSESIFPGKDRVTFSCPDKFSKHIIRKSSPWLNHKEVSILDFGGGDGALAIAIAKELVESGSRQIAITVVDLIKQNSPSNLSEEIKIDWAERIGGLSKKYDLVLASASLEHVTAPRDTFEALLEKTKTGGIIYARTPYILPLLHIGKFLGINPNFLYPAHLHDMGQAFWDKEASRQEKNMRLLRSAPSLVQSSLQHQPLTTLAAITLKSLWYIFGSRYKLVGGWEILAQKN